MRRWLGALLLLSGCASAPVRPADQPRLADADAKVLDGCYTCLLDARDTYAALAATRARPEVVGRLFETELLLGLREAELALPADDTWARAEALIPELPASADAPFLLDLVRAVPPDRSGTPRLRIRQGTRARQAFATAHLANVFTRLDASTTGLAFRNYLSASIACLAPAVGIRPTAAPVDIPPDAPPLVRYRLATCPSVRVAPLDGVVADVPAFVEAKYFQVRVPSTSMTVARVAEQRLAFAAVAERFPQSPSVLYSLGAFHQTLGDCRTAVGHYDTLLAVESDHEEGALQRIVCLGYLARHDDAIAGATRLIVERFDNMGDAYYWRAWNQHKLQRLPEARTDIDRALSLQSDSRVLSLSGIIKYEQQEYPPAERDLQGAVSSDPAQCIAQWYLGLVAFEREDWPRVASAFEASSTCYRESADRSERDLEAARHADLDPDFKASQVAGFEAVIEEDRGQEQASYLNAANGYIRAAYADKARIMLSRIPADSVHAPAARTLSDYLDAVVGPVASESHP